MNRTQQITRDWLQQSGLAGDQLLLEALLRRGFLAYPDEQGIWLGTGSHPEDIVVLRQIDGLAIEAVSGHKDRMASLSLTAHEIPVVRVALAIVAIPENHWDGHSRWTGYGLPGYLGNVGWNSYRRMTWGVKMALCPTTRLLGSRSENALDLGLGLLAKTLPLARVATHACCDGHGEKPVWIAFVTDWDSMWARAVFDVLKCDLFNSSWDWNRALRVEPIGGFGDAEVLGMLDDIQHFSRRLLHQTVIDKIGKARSKTLIALGESPPIAENFAEEARRQLAREFSS